MESKDIFGIKPYGEAIKIAVEKSADGAGKFLAAICLPAAEEFGLLLRDKLRYWRLNNIIKMIEKSEGKFEFNENTLQLKVNPRVGVEIIENASWQEDDEILQMWSGLLISSINEDGKDDSNLIFVNILKSLTGIQCRIINYICKNVDIKFDKNGLVYSDSICEIVLEELFDIVNTKDLNRLDRELDYLRSLELLPQSGLFGGVGVGFTLHQDDFTKISLKPTALAIHLYARANGYNDIKKCFK